MLKLFNLSKTRVNYTCQHISTSSATWQGKELMKMKEQEYAIRHVAKKPQRSPLVKNFFVAKVDTELLAFPEAIYENEHQAQVNERKKIYDDFLTTNIFANPDDVNNIRKLKEFGCFRRSSALMTEALYGYGESEASYLSYGTFLNNHQQVLRLVEEFGNAEQKLKYQPMLENGDFTAVPCFFEARGNTNSKKAFLTDAKYKDATNQWFISGEKSFVLMSPEHKNTTMFLVIASAESVNHVGDFEETLTAFLVDGSLPGVEITKIDETIGFGEKALKQVTVTFTDVAVEKCELKVYATSRRKFIFSHFSKYSKRSRRI